MSWRACKSLVPALLFGASLCVSAGSLAAQDLVPSRATAGKQVPSSDFGPFRVVSTTRVVLAGLTDSRSPAAFQELLRQHPQIRILELRDCPGTVDDSANLRLGRIIRRNGIRTTVPANGSVRSGAIELFLAGAERSAPDSARFVIHAWQSEGGAVRDFRAFSSSMSDTYTRYYRDMGMTEQAAQSFYRQTMAVPSGRGLSLKASELARFVPIRATLAAGI